MESEEEGTRYTLYLIFSYWEVMLFVLAEHETNSTQQMAIYIIFEQSGSSITEKSARIS